MANINAPFGLKPVGHLNGSAYNDQANLYYVPAADTNVYNIGAPVKSAAGADLNGVPQVVKALGTDTVRGVVVGILPAYPGNSLAGTPLALEQLATPGTGKLRDYYLLVADAPDIVYVVQCDVTAIAAVSMNKNASLTIADPADATRPYSATVLAGATAGTLATLNVKLRGLVRDPANAFGAYARVLITFNLHECNGATVGV